jgi:hypothetical protein
MIMRWISDVPSKIVKILAMGAVYAGQRPAAPLGISTDSARPVRDEFRFWIGSARDRRTGRGHAPVGRRGRPGSWRTPSATQCSRVGRCTYVRGIFGRRPALLPRRSIAARAGGGARTGGTRAGRHRNAGEPRAARCRADTGPLCPEHGMAWGAVFRPLRYLALAPNGFSCRWEGLGCGLVPPREFRRSVLPGRRSGLGRTSAWPGSGRPI